MVRELLLRNLAVLLLGVGLGIGCSDGGMADPNGRALPMEPAPVDLPPPSDASTFFGNTDGAVFIVYDDAGAHLVDECEEGKFCKEVTDPDDQDCGSLTLKTMEEEVLQPGNLLVIFDRSSSMYIDWMGTPRYQVAGEALIAAVDPFTDQLTIGAILYPSPDPSFSPPINCDQADPKDLEPPPTAPPPDMGAGTGDCWLGKSGYCGVNPITQPDQINFGAGALFEGAFRDRWTNDTPSRTPLQDAMEMANAAVTTAALEGPINIVIITDGIPNCGTDDTTVINQAQAWHDAGMNVYVIGLPGADGAADLLNNIASAGGTGTYLDPADPKALSDQLAMILTETVILGFDCVFNLDPAAAAPEKLHLVVTEDGKESDVPRDLSDTAGWEINGKGDKVTLTGQLCDDAKAGRFEEIRFEFGCVDLPPLPPPPPPDVE